MESLIGTISGLTSAVFISIAMVSMRKLGLRVNFYVSPFFWAICGMVTSAFGVAIRFVVKGNHTNYTMETFYYILAAGIFTYMGQIF